MLGSYYRLLCRSGQGSPGFPLCGKSSFSQRAGEIARGDACQCDQWDMGQDETRVAMAAAEALMGDATQHRALSAGQLPLPPRRLPKSLRCCPSLLTHLCPPRNTAILETQAAPKGHSHISTKNRLGRNSASTF